MLCEAIQNINWISAIGTIIYSKLHVALLPCQQVITISPSLTITHKYNKHMLWAVLTIIYYINWNLHCRLCRPQVKVHTTLLRFTIPSCFILDNPVSKGWRIEMILHSTLKRWCISYGKLTGEVKQLYWYLEDG